MGLLKNLVEQQRQVDAPPPEDAGLDAMLSSKPEPRDGETVELGRRDGRWCWRRRRLTDADAYYWTCIAGDIT